jgi:hypothetical protein
MKHVSEPLGNVLVQMYRKMDEQNKAKMRELLEDMKKQLDKLSH